MKVGAILLCFCLNTHSGVNAQQYTDIDLTPEQFTDWQNYPAYVKEHKIKSVRLTHPELRKNSTYHFDELGRLITEKVLADSGDYIMRKFDYCNATSIKLKKVEAYFSKSNQTKLEKCYLCSDNGLYSYLTPYENCAEGNKFKDTQFFLDSLGMLDSIVSYRNRMYAWTDSYRYNTEKRLVHAQMSFGSHITADRFYTYGTEGKLVELHQINYSWRGDTTETKQVWEWDKQGRLRSLNYPGECDDLTILQYYTDSLTISIARNDYECLQNSYSVLFNKQGIIETVKFLYRDGALMKVANYSNFEFYK